jgi:hypothetical protein
MKNGRYNRPLKTGVRFHIIVTSLASGFTVLLGIIRPEENSQRKYLLFSRMLSAFLQKRTLHMYANVCIKRTFHWLRLCNTQFDWFIEFM